MLQPRRLLRTEILSLMKTNDSYSLISELHAKHPDVFVEYCLGIKLFRYQKIMIKMISKGLEIKQNIRRLK